jgi:hypothetical protein
MHRDLQPLVCGTGSNLIEGKFKEQTVKVPWSYGGHPLSLLTPCEHEATEMPLIIYNKEQLLTAGPVAIFRLPDSCLPGKVSTLVP